MGSIVTVLLSGRRLGYASAFRFIMIYNRAQKLNVKKVVASRLMLLSRFFALFGVFCTFYTLLLTDLMVNGGPPPVQKVEAVFFSLMAH